MDKQHIGILHPGAMGQSLAATALISGHAVKNTRRYAIDKRSTGCLVESESIDKLLFHN